MNALKTTGILQIFLGLAIPAIYLALAVPGGNSYTDQGGLIALFPGLLIVGPSSIILLIRGIIQLIRSETHQ